MTSKPARPDHRWLAVGLLLAALVAYTWATWRYFTLPVPGGNDFMAHYTVWGAFFKEGLNPYSDEAALYTQQAIRGRPALPGEDENRLTYPFYSLLVHAPFLVLEYPLARALYMTLLQVALLAGVALTLKLVGWRPAPWLLAGVMAWSVVQYPAARGILLGQFAIIGFAALAATLRLLQLRRDAAAGAVLVVTTIKPPLIFLVLPFLLLWAVVHRRWRFMAAFAVVLAVAALAGLWLLPTWIGDWLLRVADYPSYTVGQSPVWLLTHAALPWLGEAGEWTLTAVLLAAMGLAWWRALRQRPELGAEFHWTLGWTLVVSALIVSRSATTNYVMFLLPALWVYAALDRRLAGGKWLIATCLLISFAGHWWLHLATVAGNQEQPILFVPWPAAMLVVLLAGRAWLLADDRQLSAQPAGSPRAARQETPA